MSLIGYNTDQFSVDFLYRPVVNTSIGMCTCGNCRYCGWQWAPPVSSLPETGTSLIFDTTSQKAIEAELWAAQAKILADKARKVFASLKPKYKLHADGSCTYIHGKADLLDSPTYKRVTRASF
jgi:hypothetical protein